MQQNRHKLTRIAAAVLPVVLALFVSCNRNSGDTEELIRTFAVSDFRTITVSGVCDVVLVQDTVCSVELRGIRRIAEFTEAAAENGVLVLTSEPKGSFLHPGDPIPVFFIHVDTLERVNIQESCHITTRNALTGTEIGFVVDTKMSRADLELACGTFYYWNNPNGFTLNLRGQVDRLKCWNSGLGQVDAQSLFATDVEVVNGGQGDCRVRASNKITYSLTSVGDIYYYGNPPLLEEKLVNSTGQLIKAE